MEPDIQDCCIICNEAFSSSKMVHSSMVLDLLKFLITTIKHKLFKESWICESCSTKVQSAVKFKTLFLKNIQNIKSGHNMPPQNPVTCEICNKTLNQDAWISHCDSIINSGLNSWKYLSPDLDLKKFGKTLCCEECHKLLLDFCTITNLLYLFDTQFDIDNISYTIKVEADTDKSRELQIEESTNYADFYRKFAINKEIDDVNQVDNSRGKNSAVKEKMQECNLIGDNIDTSRDISVIEEAIYIKNDPDGEESKYAEESEGNWQESNQEEGVNDVLFEHNYFLSFLNGTGLFDSEEITSNNFEICKKTYKCDICLLPISCESCFNYHMSLHVNVNEDEIVKCPKHMIAYKLFDMYKKIARVEIFQCHICKFQTKHKGCLKTHMIVHGNMGEIQMFKCPICKFQTKHKYNLKSHMNLHGNNEGVELFKCQLCNFQSKYKNNLKSHMKIHTNNEEREIFKCQICEYQTKYKHHLKSHHMNIHSNNDKVEKFKCPICNFQSKYSIKRHMIIHENSDKIQMFECHICKHQTKHKRGLRQHMIVHKNDDEVEMFKCTICEYQTKYKNNLKSHMNTHRTNDEVKIFKCLLCKYETKYKNRLKTHLNVHTNLTC